MRRTPWTGAPVHQVALRQWLPQARVYRAFNTVAQENRASPGDDLAGTGVPADLRSCGPGGADLPRVQQPGCAVGLRPVRIGDLDAADLCDGLTPLWLALALGQQRGRHLAFRVLGG